MFKCRLWTCTSLRLSLNGNDTFYQEGPREIYSLQILYQMTVHRRRSGSRGL